MEEKKSHVHPKFVWILNLAVKFEYKIRPIKFDYNSQIFNIII